MSDADVLKCCQQCHCFSCLKDCGSLVNIKCIGSLWYWADVSARSTSTDARVQLAVGMGLEEAWYFTNHGSWDIHWSQEFLLNSKTICLARLATKQCVRFVADIWRSSCYLLTEPQKTLRSAKYCTVTDIAQPSLRSEVAIEKGDNGEKISRFYTCFLIFILCRFKNVSSYTKVRFIALEWLTIEGSRLKI